MLLTMFSIGRVIELRENIDAGRNTGTRVADV